MTLLPLLKSRWFRIASVIVILSLIVLLVTPLIARYLAQQWLMENGGEQVHFEDVDFNPFAAKLVLEGLEVKVDAESTLSFDVVTFDLEWLPLLRRQVDVRSVQLTGFHMVVDNREPEAPRVGGILLPGVGPEIEPPARAKSAWLSGIKALTLQDFHILVRDRKIELDVVLDSMHLTSMAQWMPEQAATLELAGRINDAPVRIKGQLAPFAEHPRYDLDLSVEKLQLGGFEQLAAPKIDQLSGLLSYAGKLVFEQSDANLSLSEDGKIVIESLRMAMGELGLETSIGQFSLDGRLAFKQSGESVLLEQDGAASLDSLDVSVRQPALDVHNTKLELTTRVNFSDSPSGAELRVASDIALEDLAVKASQRKITLVSMETLKVEELLLQAVDELSISTISSEKIQVGKLLGEVTEQPLARSDKLQITGFSRSGRLINIEGVAYDGFHNRIVRDNDGNLNVVRFIDIIENLNAPPEAAEQTGKDALKNTGNEEQAEPVDLQIGSIRASEGSSITFIDDSVKPAFATTVTFQEISLEQLDSRKPDQNSPLRLQGAIGKYTGLSLSGNVKPFLKPTSLDLAGKIKSMDLPALSSYTWKSLGLMLDSGTLDADLKLDSKDEILNGKVDLLLHQLKLGKIESQSGLQSKIPVPMDTALNTLRDKNNTIKLTVPVKGNMADPKFDVSDAINQVLAKALKTGALSYLKHALQPYGALITAAQYAGEAVAKVRLNPVEFEPGQATLTATGTEYLTKVAKVMRERPKIAIKVCGVAVQQDQLFFQQQQQQQKAAAGIQAPSQTPAQPPVPDEKKLTDLAMDRATVVKDHLVEQYRIPASHLVGCQPRIEADQADAKPRTDLLI